MPDSEDDIKQPNILERAAKFTTRNHSTLLGYLVAALVGFQTYNQRENTKTLAWAFGTITDMQQKAEEERQTLLQHALKAAVSAEKAEKVAESTKATVDKTQAAVESTKKEVGAVKKAISEMDP